MISPFSYLIGLKRSRLSPLLVVAFFLFDFAFVAFTFLATAFSLLWNI